MKMITLLMLIGFLTTACVNSEQIEDLLNDKKSSLKLTDVVAYGTIVGTWQSEENFLTSSSHNFYRINELPSHLIGMSECPSLDEYDSGEVKVSTVIRFYDDYTFDLAKYYHLIDYGYCQLWDQSSDDYIENKSFGINLDNNSLEFSGNYYAKIGFKNLDEFTLE